MHSFDLHHGDFRRIDLNLLVAFDALMQERHVSRAAARLFVGQPAMSHALARLRDVLGDPLFVRTGNQMEPTARALALAPHIRAWLEDANQFLFAPDNFDPAQAQATFSLAAPDGMEAILYPALIAQLRTQAPGVQLRSYLLETDQQLTALDNDDVDLLITATPLPLRDWHSHQLLMQSGFTAIHAQSQLNLPDPPTLADLARCDHVASSYRGSAAGVVDHLFAANGLARRIVAMSASLIAISHIIRQAPLILKNPNDYDAWSEFMWAGTVAHNNLLNTGRIGDWASHDIEHEISGIYDVAHGAGLAVVFPAWMKHVLHHDLDRFVQWAVRVWNVELDVYNPEAVAREGIARMEAFFQSLGLGTRMKDLGVTGDRIDEMADKCTNGNTSTVGNFVKLDRDGVAKVLRLAV